MPFNEITATPSIPFTTHCYAPPSDSPPHPFQFLDIFHPTPSPSPDALWLIFIHGGAWRDPTQLKPIGHPLLTHLLTSPTLSSTPGALAAASFDYRLSPHPDHPLQTTLIHMSSTRHSAGATLALQVLLSSDSGFLPTQGLKNIKAIIGIEGIYSLPGLLDEYPFYHSFLEGAFGPPPTDNVMAEEKSHVWNTASPASASHRKVYAEYLSSGGKIVLIQSSQDELLSGRQTRMMEKVLEGLERWETARGEFGGHDEVVQGGKGVVWSLLDRVVGEVLREERAK
ncbi:hypothetical protein BDZ91DRAFT_711647 [Kalaharituber pfeilii]|nr:hypothetical protein BDZ91DRAFT_711647 [Kalaharituber pfeilii]